MTYKEQGCPVPSRPKFISIVDARHLPHESTDVLSGLASGPDGASGLSL